MRQTPTVEQQLEQQRDAFDLLCSEVSEGIRGAAHFDELEDRAAVIARGIREAFRRGLG